MNISRELLEAVRDGHYEKVCHQICARLKSGQEELNEDSDSGDWSALLLESLYRNRPEITRLILATRARLNIFESAALGHNERLQCLLECDSSLVNEYAPDGFGALHLAVYFGHLGATEILLKYGADIGIRADNPMGVYPIHSAVAGNNELIVSLLLGHGADPNITQQGGFTPLMGAASSGNESIFRILFEHGANPDIVAESGQKAADIAGARGNQGILDYLLTI